MCRKPGDPLTSGASKIANSTSEPDDGQNGGWPRERLLAMDRRFVERVERAIAVRKPAGRRWPRERALG
jgi:hypothetical protein